MKHLIIGSKGQLGSEFSKLLEKKGIDFLGVDIDTLDISDTDSVYSLFRAFKPGVVINCAAYNLVDKAEDDHITAFNVNSKGIENIAGAALEQDSFLVHYSSDYVFDGEKGSMYSEDDNPSPINKYGESKLSGENILKSAYSNYLLFRLSWVYGPGRQNFIHKLTKWAESSSQLKVANDEVSVPTSTELIASLTMTAVEKGLKGLYHLANSSYASRFEWAVFILSSLGIEREIVPVSKDIFDLPARRPAFSAMSNNQLSHDLNLEIPGWKQSLRSYLKMYHY